MLNVSYRTSGKLSCPCDGDVILCVDSDLILSGAPYIEGVLTSVTQSCDACGNILYTYYVEYDETELMTATPLVSSDITGIVCKSCLVTYIDYNTQFPLLGGVYRWTFPSTPPAGPGATLEVVNVVGNMITLDWA